MTYGICALGTKASCASTYDRIGALCRAASRVDTDCRLANPLANPLANKKLN